MVCLILYTLALLLIKPNWKCSSQWVMQAIAIWLLCCINIDNAANQSSSPGTVPIAAGVGGGVAALLLLLIILIVVLALVRRRKRKDKGGQSAEYEGDWSDNQCQFITTCMSLTVPNCNSCQWSVCLVVQTIVNLGHSYFCYGCMNSEFTDMYM